MVVVPVGWSVFWKRFTAYFISIRMSTKQALWKWENGFCHMSDQATAGELKNKVLEAFFTQKLFPNIERAAFSECAAQQHKSHTNCDLLFQFGRFKLAQINKI